MKRFFNLLCGWILVVFLTGCGSSLEPIPSREPIILNFVFREGVANYEVLADEFKKLYPEITIKLLPIESLGGNASLNLADADVIRWEANSILSDHENDLLILDDLVSGSTVFPLSDFIPGTIDALRSDDVLLGIPAGLNPMVMFANARAFKKAKTSLPAGDWNLDELVFLADAVNRQDVAFSDGDFMIGLCTSFQAFDPLILTYLYGGSIFDQLPNPTQPTLDTPINLDAIQWINSLYHEYGITPDPKSTELSSSRGYYNAIFNNKCGLWIGPMAEFKIALQTYHLENQVKILPLPYNQSPISIAAEDGYFIRKTYLHPMQAWEWVSFLIEHEESAGVMIPPRMSHLESDSFNRRAGDDLKTIVRSMQNNLIILSADLTQQSAVQKTANAFLLAVNWVITKDYDPASALESAQRVADVAFEDQ